MPDERPAGYDPYAGYRPPQVDPGEIWGSEDHAERSRPNNYVMRFLGNLGDAAEKPGRFVKGGLAAVGSGLGFNAAPDRSEALSFLPFSDSLGLTDRQNATKGSALTNQWTGLSPDSWKNQVLGFGLDVGTDPLTYVGGAFGRTGGKSLGKGLEEAAIARGPGYGTDVMDLYKSALKNEGKDAVFRLQELAGHPGFKEALSEIPTGSEYFRKGAEAMAFRTPSGQIVRLGEQSAGEPGRLMAEGIVPAVRTTEHVAPGAKTGMRVERSPFAAPIAADDIATTRALRESLAGRGVDFVDSHAGNVGMLGGKPAVFDTGALARTEVGGPFHTMRGGMSLPGDQAAEAAAKSFYAGGGTAAPFSPVTSLRAPDATERFLLDLLGGQPAMRRALDRGMAAPGYQKRFGQAGQAAGAAAGAGLGQF